MGLCWPLQMPAAPKAVLVSLADQASDDGVCWPAVGTLSVRTCLSERTVQRAVRWLQQRKALRVRVRSSEFGEASGRRQTTNAYILTPSAFLPEPGRAEIPSEVGRGDAVGEDLGTTPPSSKGCHGDGVEEGEGCHGDTPGVSWCHPRGCHGDTLTIIGTNTNTPPTPLADAKGASGPAAEAARSDVPTASLGAGDADASGDGEADATGPGGRKLRGPAGGGGEEPDGLIGFDTFLRLCRERGEKPIPPGHPVFTYCASVGISDELLRLHWAEFKARRSGARKRQRGLRGWRQAFANSVRENWFRLWWMRPGGLAELTSHGEQARRSQEAVSRETEGSGSPGLFGAGPGVGGTTADGCSAGVADG